MRRTGIGPNLRRMSATVHSVLASVIVATGDLSCRPPNLVPAPIISRRRPPGNLALAGRTARPLEWKDREERDGSGPNGRSPSGNGSEVGMVRWTLTCLLLVVVPRLAVAADAKAVAKARQLAQTGKYAEAIDAYDALAKDATDAAEKAAI